MEKKVRFITFYGHFLTHFYILILPALLLSLAKNWSVSVTELTAMGAVGYLLYGLGSLPGGWIAGKIGAKKSLMIYFLGSAAASLVIASSTSYFMFSVGIVLLGIFGSLYHVSGSTLLSHYTGKKGKSFGLHGVGGSAGITFVPVIATSLALFFGTSDTPMWQAVYYLAILLGLFGFIFLIFDRKIPEKLPDHRASEKKDFMEIKKVIPFIIIYFIIMAVNGIFYRAFLTIFPTYIDQRASFTFKNPLLTGGFISTMILSAGMLGQFVGGLLSDKFNRLKFYLVILCMIVPLVFFMGFLSALPLIVCGLFFSLVFFPVQPIENSLLSVVIPKSFVSYVFGFKFVMTFGVGSIGSYIAGYITDNFGIEKVFPVISGLVVISIILAFVLFRLSQKAQISTK